jgi:3'(2'), 5'-bisphosphate nucleotidase
VGDPELRPAATPRELRAAAERLCLPAAGVAATRVEPRLRLLADDAGAAVLLRRQWTGDGTAEAVVLHRAGVPLEHPAVVATAVAWGCDTIRHAPTGRSFAVPAPADDAPLTERFRYLAARAATRVEVAVALAGDDPDAAAQAAAADVLAPIGVPVLSEESADVPVVDGQPWIVLDPVDGTGNLSAGLPPWAFSAALVSAGRPVAGLVADLSSGRRWEGAAGAGARRDGVPVAPRPGGTVVVPSAPGGERIAVPGGADRVRVTGCTSIDLCLVADGSAAAWHDLDRSGSRVHDVAGGLAVLLAAGGAALTADGEPVFLTPRSAARVRFVAACGEQAARELLGSTPGRGPDGG